MDADKLMKIATLVNDLIGAKEPTAEELDYDDEAIQLYVDLHNLKTSLKSMGFWEY